MRTGDASTRNRCWVDGIPGAKPSKSSTLHLPNGALITRPATNYREHERLLFCPVARPPIHPLHADPLIGEWASTMEMASCWVGLTKKLDSLVLLLGNTTLIISPNGPSNKPAFYSYFDGGPITAISFPEASIDVCRFLEIHHCGMGRFMDESQSSFSVIHSSRFLRRIESWGQMGSDGFFMAGFSSL